MCVLLPSLYVLLGSKASALHARQASTDQLSYISSLCILQLVSRIFILDFAFALLATLSQYPVLVFLQLLNIGTPKSFAHSYFLAIATILHLYTKSKELPNFSSSLNLFPEVQFVYISFIYA